MNRAVKVPGALVVIAALAGGALLGILGALIAIPVAAAFLLIIKQVVIPRQNERARPAAPIRRHRCATAQAVGGGHLVGGRAAGFTAATISSSTRRLRLPTHRSAALDVDLPKPGQHREALRRLGGLQVVVVLGDERDDRRRCGAPPAQLLVARAMQAARAALAPAMPCSRPYFSASSVPNDQPTSHGLGNPRRRRTPSPPRHPPARRPSPNEPSLGPRGESVLRVLNRSTARSAMGRQARGRLGWCASP